MVHLASTVTAGTLNPAEVELEAALLHRVLDGLSSARVPHLAVMSSAMVYGAWRDNPVPITEDAAVRPNPDFDWALQRHRLERLAQQWGAGPGRSVTVLRPAAVVAEDRLGQLANTLRAARSGVAADGDPPVQYLHADDLAAAVVTSVNARYDGILNVAPDGWIPPDTLAELEGPRPRLRVPSHLARLLSALRWRSGLAPTPPGVVPYTIHPWVVANDRLRALGWRADHTNEEAWVVSHEPGPSGVAAGPAPPGAAAGRGGGAGGGVRGHGRPGRPGLAKAPPRRSFLEAERTGERAGPYGRGRGPSGP